MNDFIRTKLNNGVTNDFKVVSICRLKEVVVVNVWHVYGNVYIWNSRFDI